MQLSIWTYEGPPHIGAMRVATSMEGVHLMLHAPQGDTYADLLFTMIERNKRRPPVTYTTFQSRHLGGDTADLIIQTAKKTEQRFRPDVMLVAESCTAELLQDQSGALVGSGMLDCQVVPVEMHAYSRKENWGASETLYALVKSALKTSVGAAKTDTVSENAEKSVASRPSVNLIGPTSLGYRCRDNIEELRRLLDAVGVDINVVAPLGATMSDLARIPAATANVSLYPEVSALTCQWLERNFGQPVINSTPIGVSGTHEFLEEIAAITGVDVSPMMGELTSRLPWYSRSVDSNYLTGKRVFVFGDATHAIAAARVARDEFGFNVVGLGTYSREQAKAVRSAAKEYGLTALITDDYLEVERAVAESQPELLLGTQMERHIAKRVGCACAVISTPAHVQDYPARYSPTMGFEGANVLFDTWVHPLMMGLEEHLIQMFSDDFEFNEHASHLGARLTDAHASKAVTAVETVDDGELCWEPMAEKELRKIPFFVRGKARRNTEQYASDHGLSSISVDTLYEAKAHFSR